MSYKASDAVISGQAELTEVLVVHWWRPSFKHNIDLKLSSFLELSGTTNPELFSLKSTFTLQLGFPFCNTVLDA